MRSVKRARNYTDDVEFSDEDAGRADRQSVPRGRSRHQRRRHHHQYSGHRRLHHAEPVRRHHHHLGLDRVPNIDKAIISVHCHDDLGMAVGNSIAAVQAGARQVEGTLNGIGERAGNCSLEEVIMAIKVRQDIMNVYTNINHQEIFRTSQIVSQLCNMGHSARWKPDPGLVQWRRKPRPATKRPSRSTGLSSVPNRIK